MQKASILFHERISLLHSHFLTAMLPFEAKKPFFFYSVLFQLVGVKRKKIPYFKDKNYKLVDYIGHCKGENLNTEWVKEKGKMK